MRLGMSSGTPGLEAGPIDSELALRAALACDEPMLYRWHVEAYRGHIERLWGWGWDESWQRRDFGKLFAALPPQVVVRGGEDIGYFQTQLRAADLHLANIVIRPAARGQGVGSTLLRHLQAEAMQLGPAVTLKVFRSNSRARYFYHRHGFEATGRSATHLEMRWADAAGAAH